MLKIIITTVFVYSFILTCVCIYKDSSGYFSMDDIDAVTAGPCMWLLMLLLLVFRPILKRMHKKREQKPYVPKSRKYIEKIVEKIIRTYRKHTKVYYDTDIFDISRIHSSEYGDVCGWENLEIRLARYERQNRRFSKLMLYQESDTIDVLTQYLDIVPKEEVAQNWNLDRNKTYYRLRKVA